MTFLIWTGSKKNLLKSEVFKELIAKGLRDSINYIEPFVGGGSVAKYIGETYDVNLWLSDINKTLINTYNSVLSSPSEVLKQVEFLVERADYYAARDRFNDCQLSGLESAGYFLYLNRMCFRGLHRECKRGRFNVPLDKSRKTLDISKLESDILEFKEATKGVTFLCTSFDNIMRSRYWSSDDFIYLDPPYLGDFSAYNSTGFSIEDHDTLMDWLFFASKNGSKFLLSSSDHPTIKEWYSNYRITEVEVKRGMGDKPSSRTVKELLISNY